METPLVRVLSFSSSREAGRRNSEVLSTTRRKGRAWSCALAIVGIAGCARGAPAQASRAPEAKVARGDSDAARSELDALIEAQRVKAHIPGVAVVAVKGDAVVLSAGYGLADIASGRKMTPDDVLLLASISKVVTATALLQKQERGLIGLDDDVNAKAPFAVRNPRHPEVPITYRMLMTHTSSISDTEELEAHIALGGDSPEPLRDFLASYLTPEGEVYAEDHWRRGKPGTKYEYSNVGAALQGAIDESLAGESLEADCKKHIFGPLGMMESSWSYAGVDPKRMATLYAYDFPAGDPPEGESGKRFIALPPYGFPDYPDGQLRTSALQLSVFMRALMNGGTFQGVKILDATTVRAMLEPQVPELEPSQGLAVYYEDFEDHLLVGHSGSYDGVSTDMFWDPRTKVGFVMLANSDVYLRENEHEQDALMALEAAVLDYASR